MRLVTFRAESGASHAGELAGNTVRELAAPTLLEWLQGEGREPTGAEHALDDVALLAPVPEPPSVRDFFAFEGHAATGFKLRGAELPEAWYAAPVFYFSNPASIQGPDEEIRRPPECQWLDFELEIAAVIGADGDIAGFTLMNDWSARDVQREEMAVALGPHKGKDFATSLGPWLVTPDELPYRDGRLHLEATVTLNGRELSTTRAEQQHFTWPQLRDQAARNTRLRPGDVLGSGTITGGCLLELGPIDGERWLEPGDVIRLEADGLGALENQIA